MSLQREKEIGVIENAPTAAHGRFVIHSVLERRKAGVSTHHWTLVHDAFGGVEGVGWKTVVISTCLEDRGDISGSNRLVHPVH